MTLVLFTDNENVPKKIMNKVIDSIKTIITYNKGLFWEKIIKMQIIDDKKKFNSYSRLKIIVCISCGTFSSIVCYI